MGKSEIENAKNNFEIDSFCIDYRSDNQNGVTKSSYQRPTPPPVSDSPNNTDYSPADDSFLSDFENNNTNISTDVPNNVEYSKSESSFQKRPKVFIAITLSLISIFMVVLLVFTLNKNSTFSKDTHEYESFILPVVMQDPQAFEDISKADMQMVAESSVWNAILSKPKDYYNNFDDYGNVIIPIDDIYNSAKELFGPDCPLNIENINSSTLFDIDSQENTLHIKPKSSYKCYTPSVQIEKINTNSIILSVLYLPQETPYSSDNSEINTQKKMRYTLEKGVSGQKYYIKAISEF